MEVRQAQVHPIKDYKSRGSASTLLNDILGKKFQRTLLYPPHYLKARVPRTCTAADIIFVIDSRVLGFVVKGWNKEGTSDPFCSMEIDGLILAKLDAPKSKQTTPYNPATAFGS